MSVLAQLVLNFLPSGQSQHGSFAMGLLPPKMQKDILNLLRTPAQMPQLPAANSSES